MLHSDDPVLIRKYLDQNYAARFAIRRTDEAREPVWCTHLRTEAGEFAVEEIMHRGRVRMVAERVPSVIALSVLEGRVEVDHAGMAATAGPGDWVLASTGNGSVRLRMDDARMRSLVVARSLMTEAPRFTELIPHGPGAGRMLGETERFLRAVLTEQTAAEHSPLLRSCGRMLASALLSCFPTTGRVEDATGDTLPVTLRQAMQFINGNATRNIGVVDIASALYMSPRTVQYLFRRHLDTTPTAYLRQVRLARARAQLLTADRNVTTVAAIAARWGFAHTGRFAVLYRRTYGESPHETLRR